MNHNKINNLIKYNDLCIIDLKLRGVHFLYLLKSFLYIKKIFNNLHFNFSFLPNKNKQIVILRSPFIYKYSRLKFNFKIYSMILKLKFFNSLNNKILKFLLNKLVNLFLKNNLVFSIKKKIIAFFF